MREELRGTFDAHHAQRLGGDALAFREARIRIVPRDGERSLCIVSNGAALVVSGPQDAAMTAAALTTDPSRLPDPEALRSRLGRRALEIVGPARIAHRATPPGISSAPGEIRPLGPAERVATARLRDATPAREWQRAGLDVAKPCVGIFEADRLVAAAGFETLESVVANLAVLTHPAARRRGAGRRALAAAADLAHARGLLLQFEALETNAASLRIADSLGFEPWGRALVVRLDPLFARGAGARAS